MRSVSSAVGGWQWARGDPGNEGVQTWVHLAPQVVAMGERLASTGDLLAGMLSLEQSLPTATVSVPKTPARRASKK